MAQVMKPNTCIPNSFNRRSEYAAHSNIIKASARVLLELKGEAKSGVRTLTVIGNELAGEKLSIQINLMLNLE